MGDGRGQSALPRTQGMADRRRHAPNRWQIADDTRRTVRKAWESLAREPEPWMRAEKDHEGN